MDRVNYGVVCFFLMVIGVLWTGNCGREGRGGGGEGMGIDGLMGGWMDGWMDGGKKGGMTKGLATRYERE